MKIFRPLLLVLSCYGVVLHAAAPDHVDLTWMSITNMYFEVGDKRLIADGYFTRIPQDNFYGGGGYKSTHAPYLPDTPTVKQVMNALGGAHAVNLLLTEPAQHDEGGGRYGSRSVDSNRQRAGRATSAANRQAKSLFAGALGRALVSVLERCSI